MNNNNREVHHESKLRPRFKFNVFVFIKQVYFGKYHTLIFKCPPPTSKTTIYFRNGKFRFSKPPFKMNTCWILLAINELKRYVHANYRIIKACRAEQTLKGRNDKHSLN